MKGYFGPGDDGVEPHITKLAFISPKSEFPFSDDLVLAPRHAHLGIYEICMNAGVLFYFEKYPSLCGTGESLPEAILDAVAMIGHNIESNRDFPRDQMTQGLIDQLESLAECFEIRKISPE